MTTQRRQAKWGKTVPREKKNVFWRTFADPIDSDVAPVGWFTTTGDGLSRYPVDRLMLTFRIGSSDSSSPLFLETPCRPRHLCNGVGED